MEPVSSLDRGRVGKDRSIGRSRIERLSAIEKWSGRATVGGRLVSAMDGRGSASMVSVLCLDNCLSSVTALEDGGLRAAVGSAMDVLRSISLEVSLDVSSLLSSPGSFSSCASPARKPEGKREPRLPEAAIATASGPDDLMIISVATGVVTVAFLEPSGYCNGEGTDAAKNRLPSNAVGAKSSGVTGDRSGGVALEHGCECPPLRPCCSSARGFKGESREISGRDAIEGGGPNMRRLPESHERDGVREAGEMASWGWDSRLEPLGARETGRESVNWSLDIEASDGGGSRLPEELEVATELEPLLEALARILCSSVAKDALLVRSAAALGVFDASLALADSGRPSHFELTLGTFDGSFCVDTPGRPTAVALPPFSAASLRCCSA